MIQLAPFESEWEQREYCSLAHCDFEEGSIGFKFFSETEKLGLVQIHFVGDVKSQGVNAKKCKKFYLG